MNHHHAAFDAHSDDDDKDEAALNIIVMWVYLHLLLTYIIRAIL